MGIWGLNDDLRFVCFADAMSEVLDNIILGRQPFPKQKEAVLRLLEFLQFAVEGKENVRRLVCGRDALRSSEVYDRVLAVQEHLKQKGEAEVFSQGVGWFLARHLANLSACECDPKTLEELKKFLSVAREIAWQNIPRPVEQVGFR